MEVALKKRSQHIRRQKTKPSTVAEFEKWEARQKGDWNYEFYHGEIIKKGGIKQIEIYLFVFLSERFMLTDAKKNGGALVAEIDVPIDEQRKRVADLAFFNREQIISMASGQKEVPAFAIELLSKNELFEKIEEKLQDYFDAGVQLVWYIAPTSKRIYAYSPNKSVQIFAAKDIAVAAPVLPDFKVDIDKLFTIA